MASSMATVRAWPRWSEPVTLGGGIHKVKVRSCACGSLSWIEKCYVNARRAFHTAIAIGLRRKYDTGILSAYI